ncbi:MAG: 4Fe-4S dicluster domain-containing protein [Coriobacteriia bacterium]|nr:4Fe-4S dicluster domain-containing protein [Coriobacteriia bacterium]
MAEYAILYDASKCSACKGCQVQCKQWNMMPSSLGKDDNEFTGSYQSMPDLNGDTRLLIEFREEDNARGIEWAFSRRACFHCKEPACMDVCPVGAISQLPDGTVKLDSTKCVGCKYCTAACPFEIPKYRDAFNVSNKCTLCDDRTAQGREPACVQTCPAGAMAYGPRDEMIAAGKARIDELKAEGFDKAELYGETEMGGMHSLFVAKYGYETHGLVRDPKAKDITSLMAIMKPLTGIGIAAVVGGLGVSFLTAIGYEREDMPRGDKKEGKQ